jgi:hypothetical protein
MHTMGVEVKKGRRLAGALQPGRHTVLADVTDPHYQWLVDHWTIYGNNDQWVYIDCPWRDGHTDGLQGYSSTAYSPLDYGRAGRTFKCLHGHCTGKSTTHFLQWINHQLLHGATA